MSERLSKTERCVLELAGTGLSTREVAVRLGVPTERVRRVVLGAIVALGASSKLEAIIVAIREGLIDPTRFL